MRLKRKSFDYFYMFVMVIYMASMSYATKTLFSISPQSIIGVLVPNILTLILIVQNKNKLKGSNPWLNLICIVLLAWMAVIAAKFGIIEARSGLYTIYYVLVAYVQVRIYGKSLFLYFEDIMVLMAKITLVMWLLGVLLPPVADIYTMFPLSIESDNRTMEGYNVLYLFCWNSDYESLIPRNAGFSWEPGRYAIMLALAIMVNLYRNGIKFKNNSNVIWLLISMATTMSTTGFSIVLVLYIYFVVKKINFKYVFIVLTVFVPLIYGISQLDFMGAKIREQIEKINSSDELISQLQWNEANNPNHYEALGRFISIYFEFQNIQHDPITGYGPTANLSYFSRAIISNATLVGGLLKEVGRYGIPLMLFFYFILFRSSVSIARTFDSKKRYAFFIYCLMSQVSYEIFCQALFISFWFYGVFDESTEKKVKNRVMDGKVRNQKHYKAIGNCV